MRCPLEGREGADLVLDYCARRLDPDKTEWFERHLAACVSCRELVAAQKQVWEALDYWDALPQPRNFDQRLEWRIEAEEGRQWFHRMFGAPLTAWLRSAIPMASVATIALAIFMIQTPKGPDAEFQSTADGADMEQTESALEDLDMIRQLTLPPRDPGAGSQI